MDLRVLYTNYRDAYQIYKDIQMYLKGIPVDDSNIAMRCHTLSHMEDTKIQYAKQFHGVHYAELNRLYEHAHRDYVNCKGEECDSKLQYKNKCKRDLYGIVD
jgi:hypothetical protein